MTLTEDEAKTKWCPMARVPILDCSRAIPVTVAANRDHYGDPTASGCCIASGCMLWTWDQWQERGRCGLGRV